ncbi:hypothetical protein [Litchfieldella xinjiangensis]|uniref:hypothetical protein n=1 Tax=Litchfieldella xinjiangensis TaxID=1166948 RepID=UPI0005BAFCA1|nr:hypothetical protein [Halomonas xinjiangensis]
MPNDYTLTQWRKRLERQGWVSLRRKLPPNHRLVEYHVIWQGRLFSGRVLLSDHDTQRDYWEPGTPIYLLHRGQDVVEGVWRFARDPAAATGQVVRPLPQ